MRILSSGKKIDELPKFSQIDSEVSFEKLDLTDVSDYFQLIERNRDFFLRSQAGAANIKTLDEAASQISIRVREAENNLGIHFKVFYQLNFVGIIALRSINWNHKKCVVGYFFDEAYAGKKIAKRSLLKLVEIAFSELELNRIVAHTSVINLASNYLLHSVGFKKEGVLREDFLINGQFIDDNAYALLKRDWRK